MSRTHRSHRALRHSDRFWTGLKRKDLGRDKKPWYKPPKQLKQLHRRRDRARYTQALREGKELPVIKRYDIWEWT